MNTADIVVVGGGAAGYFGAIRVAELRPDWQVVLIERSQKVLEKVRVSGGGRCNVCHAEYDPRALTAHYPRGAKALRGPFHQFCSGDTVGWYHDRGVELKTEDDGRMFPVSNSSATIVQCLQDAARSAGVRIRTGLGLKRLEPLSDGTWRLHTTGDAPLEARQVLLAPGSSPAMWKELERLGHRIVEPVPSLFTFKIQDARLDGLPGLSVPHARLKGEGLETEGPLLITHWGLSGPAVLRLSAWGARHLHAVDYRFDLQVNWTGAAAPGSVAEEVAALRQQQGKRNVHKQALHGLPSRLWKRLCEAAGIHDQLRWGDVSKAQAQLLDQELTCGSYPVTGKSTFKEEFVTAGGIDLDEVNFKTMESKLFPGIYFAGEFLDIDAITGGFNFQAAWTTSWIAGTAMAQR